MHSNLRANCDKVVVMKKTAVHRSAHTKVFQDRIHV